MYKLFSFFEKLYSFDCRDVLESRARVKLHHLGVRRIVKERGSPEFVGSFIDDLVDSDGQLNWCEASSGSHG